MIDVHSHILPGVDDGAKHIVESVAMAREASEKGIHTVIATPHHKNGKYDNPKIEVIEQVKLLNQRLHKEKIPVHVLPGQEIRVNGDILHDIEQGHILPINETSGYLFLELPSSHLPQYVEQLVFELQLQGYKPIIVHPERNRVFIDDPSLLYSLVKKGVLTQINAETILGLSGKKIKKFSYQLIENNLAHFIASDAHDAQNRNPGLLKEAYQAIRKKYGNQVLHSFKENAELLIKGELVLGNEPLRASKKKVLGLF